MDRPDGTTARAPDARALGRSDGPWASALWVKRAGEGGGRANAPSPSPV